MKKLLLLAAALLVAGPVFAQPSKDGDTVIASSEDGKFIFSGLEHVGYGYHYMSDATYDVSASEELFYNLLNFSYFPTPSFGFTLGIDYEFNIFSSEKSAFILDGTNKVQTVDFSTVVSETAARRQRSSLFFHTINFPLMACVRLGSFGIAAGAEASLNFGGSVRYKYKNGDIKYKVAHRKAELEPFTYGLVARISYEEVGIYGKFYPKSSKVLPDGSVDLNYFTIGVQLGF